MRDHRPGLDPTVKVDITDLVVQARERATRHPGSVRRSSDAKKRAAAKRAKASRKANRS